MMRVPNLILPYLIELELYFYFVRNQVQKHLILMVKIKKKKTQLLSKNLKLMRLLLFEGPLFPIMPKQFQRKSLLPGEQTSSQY